jgi:hypothetical protein
VVEVSPPLLPHVVIQRDLGKKPLELCRKLCEPSLEAAARVPLTPRPPVPLVHFLILGGAGQEPSP